MDISTVPGLPIRGLDGYADREEAEHKNAGTNPAFSDAMIARPGLEHPAFRRNRLNADKML